MCATRLRNSKDAAALPGAAWRRRLATRLLAWYARHRRDLPWRRTRDPYAIWVSEIMLQQTQVATVIPYFARFMETFPSIAALAAADEHDVFRVWEGLGYYRRARQMHHAAKVLVERHGGRFPRKLEEVRALPGIGRYTAGAIVSIAFDRPAPIVEANTVRLFSRLVGYRDDVYAAPGQQLLWELAEAVLPERNCREFNQALMELGSLVCTPREPKCESCPLRTLCAAHTHGLQGEIPAPRPKPPSEAVREAAVVVWRAGKVLLRQCPKGERWAGLWDFPRFPVTVRRNPAATREIVERIRRQTGLAITPPRHIATLKHGVTRFRITLDCYSARSTPGGATSMAGGWQWLRPGELDRYALSTTGRQLGQLLQSQGAKAAK